MDNTLSTDPRAALLNSPLSRYQIAAISVTVLLCALDGFDVLAVTYAAPGFLDEWGLSRGQLGIALSMGLVGMALGSFFLAPLADMVGRRRMIFICLMVMSAGMLASGFSSSIVELSLWRVVTGLGIGAMICIINPLAAEYSNAKRRDLSVGLMAMGYPIGGTLGGLAAAWLLQNYGWRSVFFFGAGLAIVFLPLVHRWLPEPVAWLIDNPKSNSLEKVNRFLNRCGHKEVVSLPAPSVRSGSVPVVELFDRDRRASTLLLTALYALYFMTVYFFLSWMPQMVVDLGFTPATAAKVSVTRDLTGIVGGVLLGWLAFYLGLKRLAVIFAIGVGITVALFNRVGSELVLIQLVAASVGFCAYGGIVAVYAIMARNFDTHVRASGTGFVIGVGRITSAVAPLLGGYLFSLSMSGAEVSAVMALGAISAAFILLFYKIRAIEVN